MLIWSIGCDQPSEPAAKESTLAHPRDSRRHTPDSCFFFLLFPSEHTSSSKSLLADHYWREALEQELRVEADDFLFCFTLPELKPVARFYGRGSVHLGTCWTWRICLFATRSADACGSRQLLEPVVFSSAKSRKRADGNMEGTSLDWAKKGGRAELQCWFCVPGAKRHVHGRAMLHPSSWGGTPSRVLWCSASVESTCKPATLQGLHGGQEFCQEFLYVFSCPTYFKEWANEVL